MILPIKKQWFDMIKTGIKKEEYREIKPYYDSRFGKYLFGLTLDEELMTNEILSIYTIPIIFRNGYSKNSPKIKCICKIQRGYGKEEWGAEKGKEYYVLEILEVIDHE